MQLHAARIHVSPFTRLDWHVIVHDPCALGLEASRQVHQRTGIEQLLQCSSGGLGQVADQVQEAKAIGSRALDQAVVDVVLLALEELVALFPVAADTDDIAGVLVQRDDVGQRNASDFTVFVFVLKAVQVVIQLELKQADLFFLGVG